MRKEIIQRVYEKGLDLGQYVLLSTIKNGEDWQSLLAIKKIEGIVNLLVRKEFLTEDLKLSEKGEQLVTSIKGTLPAFSSVVTTTEPSKDRIDTFDVWTFKLLTKLKGRLKELIGKDQIKGFGNVYFIPQIEDLREFLLRFNKKYKYSLVTERDKIEKILIKHVERCAKIKSFAPAIMYYIIKQGSPSQLATALENYVSIETADEEIKEQHTVTKTKDLF